MTRPATGRLYQLTANSAQRDLWLAPSFEDHDYRVVDALTAGEFASLGFIPTFSRVNAGKRLGDLLWVGGAPFQLASDRFASVLTEIDASGFLSYPVTILDRGEPLTGYTGLAITASTADADLCNGYGTPSISFVVNQRVYDAMRAAGVTDYGVEPFLSE